MANITVHWPLNLLSVYAYIRSAIEHLHAVCSTCVPGYRWWLVGGEDWHCC